MSDYISRKEFENRIKPYDTTDSTDKALYNFAHNHMICCPSADVRENMHAYWELNARGIWSCPKCGTEVYDGNRDKFCRVCGADFKDTPHEQMIRANP